MPIARRRRSLRGTFELIQRILSGREALVSDEKTEEPDVLTPEDEEILDKIWLEILREEEAKEKWGK